MKIHYHSDCYIFGGCENILVNLLNNEQIENIYDISYSFPSFSHYKLEADHRIKRDIKKYPLFLPDSSKFNYLLFHKNNNKYLRDLMVLPIYLFEKCYLFMIYDSIRLFFLLKRVKPDILHINSGGYPPAESCRAAVIAAKYANINRIVFHVNSIAEDFSNYYPIKGMIEKSIDNFIKNNVDIFITGSIFARLKLAENRNFSLDQIINIPNTIIPRKIIENREKIKTRLNLLDDDFIFGNVALLTKRKGHTVLIRAFSILKQKLTESNKIKLVIEGEGEEEENLKKLVANLNLDNDVIFIGSQKNIFDIYNICDVFILSSIYGEDMPNVIIEAMSLGKPVIGSNIAGIPEEIKDNANGFVVDVNNAEELSEAMFKLVVDTRLREKMGLKSKEIFNSKFSYEIIIDNYIDLYCSLR